MKRFILYLAVLLLCNITNIYNSIAQSRSNQLIQVLVAPNNPSWTYNQNEEISFTVSILKNHVPLKNTEVTYKIGMEKMKPLQEGSILLKESNQLIGKSVAVKEPGFLRCEVSIEVDGVRYRGFATAGIAPLKIQPTQTYPNDFLTFWQNEIAKAKTIALDPKMTLIPEKCTEKVNVYHISFQNDAVGSRIYGMLTVPSKPGKYPAVLQVPGAGTRPYDANIGYSDNNIISLQIGIHGIPVNMPVEVYNNLGSGALKGYPFFNLENRDEYYFKRVYLGCVRALDFIFQLPDFDGEHAVVQGGSQGGALAIITAALDKRIKGLASLYPALSDLTGYMHQRAGGWPHMFLKEPISPEKVKTSAYYDVVNFAKHVNVPGFYSWGYNDETCPPTSYYSAYNMINAPKELYLIPETGHWTFGEQFQKLNEWVINFLK